jgi:hypothetical protein
MHRGGPPIIIYFSYISITKDEILATNLSMDVFMIPIQIVGGALAEGFWRSDMVTEEEISPTFQPTLFVCNPGQMLISID